MKPTISGRWMMIWVVVLIVSMKTGAIGKVVNPLMAFGANLVPYPMARNAPSPEGYPEIILAPDKAAGVRYWTYPLGDSDPNGYCTVYGRYETYPAKSTLNSLRHRLSASGWRRLDYLLMDPNSLGGTEWKVSQDDAEGVEHYEWSEDWITDGGKAVLLRLAYEKEPDRQEVGKNLIVRLWFLESSRTSGWMSVYRRKHPEESIE